MERKRLAVIIAVVAVLLALLFINFAYGAQRTFKWQQVDVERTDYWVLAWGVIPGGPYDVGQVRIDKTADGQIQREPVEVLFPPCATTTYYFVFVAFNKSGHSADSNERSLTITDESCVPGAPVFIAIEE